MIAAIAGLIPGFLLRFLGSGVVSQVLEHNRKKADSANETLRIKYEHKARKAQAELKRREIELDHRVAMRQQQLELQLKEAEIPSMRWPKIALMWAVSGYWSLRIGVVKTLGLKDFGVAIPELSPEEAAVSGAVLLYLLGEAAVNKFRKPSH